MIVKLIIWNLDPPISKCHDSKVLKKEKLHLTNSRWNPSWSSRVLLIAFHSSLTSIKWLDWGGVRGVSGTSLA